MRVVVVGNGVAGVTAARKIRTLQPDWKITIVSGESRFHYSRPALMYIYMGHMRYQDAKPFEDVHWSDLRLDLVQDWVVEINVQRRRLRLQGGDQLPFDRLLLATGSRTNRFGWKGQDLEGVQGLYDLMDLRRLQENTRSARRAVIVGGGLIGIELAEMLHFQGIDVSFLVREGSYWDNVLPKEESAIINRLIRAHGFDLRLKTQLREIVDDGTGRACAVITDAGQRIDCQLVGLTAGVSPNIDLVRDSPIRTGRGILVDSSLKTSIDGVFAAGDCAEVTLPGEKRGLVQQVWYTGRAQGEVAGQNIAGRQTVYRPGVWFNSARFLDLDYQVYGRVNMRVDGEDSLYWEHQSGRHAVRVVHVDGTVIGFNFMGLRYRHEVCERWILQKRSVEEVLARLGEGNFDPEFFRRHETEIARVLRDQYYRSREGAAP